MTGVLTSFGIGLGIIAGIFAAFVWLVEFLRMAGWAWAVFCVVLLSVGAYQIGEAVLS